MSKCKIYQIVTWIEAAILDNIFLEQINTVAGTW